MISPPLADGGFGTARASRPRGVGWRTELVGAVVVTVRNPVTWMFGLASFLAGGGILLVGLPVAVLPTPSGIQNALGGPVSTLVVGTPSSALITLIAAAIISLVVAIVGGTIIGAWAEREGVLVVASAAEAEALTTFAERPPAPSVWSVAAVRLLSLVPVAVAAALAWQPVYDAAYHELVLPTDLATPLVLRVLRAVPLPLILLGLAWLLSDSAASISVRMLVRDRTPVLRAWAAGWLELVRRPIRSLGTAGFGLLVFVALIGPAMLAAVAAWTNVKTIMLPGNDAIGGLVAVAVWVGLWLVALLLAGLASAVRAAAWTLMVVPTDEPRTTD